jgi:hypothetical protein
MTRDPIANLADVIDAGHAINAAVARMSTQSSFDPAVGDIYDASITSVLRDLLAALAETVARLTLDYRLKHNTDSCHCDEDHISLVKPCLD